VTKIYQTKLSQIGNSMGLILPKEIFSHLKIHVDSKLYIIETLHGIEITPYDPSFVEAISIAEQVMDQNKNVLKKLAE
jgi:putative addiction module antidote